ncbi:hypothetical protein [Paenarthrobacter aromaticivorans]|uniref:IS110 family transposase n=1 Tax=Paenarthrobacter aromaticivorans TaxID=2849150 RepID=A0ABS6I7T4_9MICC|nr:hypothetical protein [Paenarthrobacter sp. MMS21-TAE1-1]MBU8867783.1 hypothetical protein [Paenarthrobacter sp. MMS21-TAE1-1]
MAANAILTSWQPMQGKLRQWIPELAAALNGRFGDHHVLMTRLYLEQIDARSRRVKTLTEAIERLMQPFRQARDALCAIPGVSALVADVLIEETGADMSVFSTAGKLAAPKNPRDASSHPTHDQATNTSKPP